MVVGRGRQEGEERGGRGNEKYLKYFEVL